MANDMSDSALAERLVAVPDTRQLDVLAALRTKHGANVVRRPLVSITDTPNSGPVDSWLHRMIAALPYISIFYTGEGAERRIDELISGLQRTCVAAMGPVVCPGRFSVGLSGYRRTGVKKQLQGTIAKPCAHARKALWPAALLAILGIAGATATPAAAKQSGASTATHFDYKHWDAYQGGPDSSQYSSLDQINTKNVGQLQVAWTYETGPGQPPLFNPTIGGGRMYVMAGGKIAALDPATGRELWKSNSTGRIGTRGVNYWRSPDGSDERLLLENDGYLRAMNAKTGQWIDSFGTDGKVDLRDALPPGHVPTPRPLMNNNPGHIFENTFIVGLPERGDQYAAAPADVQAYDVRTGALKWAFHVVPQKGEFGYDTWPAKDHEKFGGVDDYSGLTVDPKAGIVYVPLSGPRYDFYGGNRPGNNLFADSLVALDARTGKRLWHFQTIHHDVWDFDLPNAPKLMTIHKDGKDIPVVIQATKTGFVFVFDRRTGKPVWPIVEKRVPASDVPGEQTSPTQPVPTWPKPFARQGVFTPDMINPYISKEDQAKLRELLKTARNQGLFTPPSLQGTISLPGHNGGANWGSSAVDPEKHLFFVVSKQMPVDIKLKLETDPSKLAAAEAAMPNGGGDVKPYKSPVDFMLQSNGLPAIDPPWSLITGYDMDTGKKLWSLPDGEVTMLAKKGIHDTGSTAPRGGPVATAGGLVFVGTSSDRMVRARDEMTGKVLWKYQLDAASEGVPAVYEAGGKEYVVFPVGGNGLFLFAPKLGQPKPGPSRYVAFALPGGK